MATLIDELLIKIGFDTKDLEVGRKRLGDEFKSIQDAGETAGKRLEESGKRASSFFDDSNRAALGLLATLGAVSEAIKTAAAASQASAVTAAAIGMDPHVLQVVQEVMHTVGASFDATKASLSSLSSAMADFNIHGGSAMRQKAFSALHINPNEDVNHPERAYEKAIDYINRSSDSLAMKRQFLNEVFGSEADHVLAMAQKGPDAYRKLYEEFDKGVVSDKGIADLNKLAESIASLENNLHNLQTRLLALVSPQLTKLIEDFNWFIENHDQAAMGIMAVTEALTALGSVWAFAKVFKKLLGPGGATSAAEGGAAAEAGAAGAGAEAGGAAAAGAGAGGFFAGLGAFLLKWGPIMASLGMVGATQSDPADEARRRELAKKDPYDPKTNKGYLDPSSGPSLWEWLTSGKWRGAGTYSDENKKSETEQKSDDEKKKGTGSPEEKTNDLLKDIAKPKPMDLTEDTQKGIADKIKDAFNDLLSAVSGTAGPGGSDSGPGYHGRSSSGGGGGDTTFDPNKSDLENAKAAIAKIEGASYTTRGGDNKHFLGKYQFGGSQSRDYTLKSTANFLNEPVPSDEEFLNNPAMQERYMNALLAMNNKYLMEHSPEYRAMSDTDKLAVLGYAHNQGAGGAASWLRTGIAGRDAFNTSGTAYSNAIKAMLARRTSSVDDELYRTRYHNHNDNSRTHMASLEVGDIHIHSQATDADQISRDIHRSIARHLVTQGNTGLASLILCLLILSNIMMA